MYVTDAEEVGDTELAKFFQKVQDEERRRADHAKQFLGARLGK
jgi:rubrerythrin